MPPRGQDGGAARAGADNSLEDAIDVSPLVPMLPTSPEERHTLAQDMARFTAKPGTVSFVRPYHKGEVHPFLLLPYGGRTPLSVAVALVCPGLRVRVLIWPGVRVKAARRLAEQEARRTRMARGLQGQA